MVMLRFSTILCAVYAFHLGIAGTASASEMSLEYCFAEEDEHLIITSNSIGCNEFTKAYRTKYRQISKEEYDRKIIIQRNARAVEERARRLAEDAKRAMAEKKAAAEAAVLQARIKAEQKKKLAAEAKKAKAEARRKAAKVKEAFRKRLAALSKGKRPENTFMDVAVKSARIRKLPERNALVVGKRERNDQVHVVSVLPSGWVQVAEEGEPTGWMHKSVLRTSKTSPAISLKQPPPSSSSPKSTLYLSRKPINVRFSSSKTQPDDIAVIIGNADYKKQGKDIPNVTPAYADAEGIKQYFMRAKGVREGNIIHLMDATSAQMAGVFGNKENHKGQLFNWTKPNVSNVYVYYAGHGAPAGNEGTAYLVPSDATSETVDLTGYPLATLYKNLGKIPAKSVTVILEACFSGTSQAGSLIPSSSGITVEPKVPLVPKNITVISAGAANQIASWDKDKSHSLFTKYFLKGMSGEGDKKPYGNGDDKVTHKELGKYLEATMTYYARRYYGRDQKAQIVNGG
jgi:uncharacterized caspase-like protein